MHDLLNVVLFVGFYRRLYAWVVQRCSVFSSLFVILCMNCEKNAWPRILSCRRL